MIEGLIDFIIFAGGALAGFLVGQECPKKPRGAST